MKDVFVEELKVPERRVTVLHHGFDLDAWRETSAQPTDIRTKFGIENKIVLGAVGRLFWVKDFARLIEAFEVATIGRDDVVLLIVGGGDRGALARLITESGLNDKVILAGRREDIASVINSFDVFVHSSLAESFGMVFIEAFALGKPIVSTIVGVAPEIIQDGVNGFLAETGNTKSLAAAMTKMFEQKEIWKEMGENGRQIAEAFAVQKTQAICDEFYLNWLSKG
jgi:glycosyltransferase involved in cell wall biosynthesis